MATWSVNALYRFLEHFPQTVNAGLSDVQNNVFRLYYKGLVSALKQILENVGRFINILLNFININAYNSYYDTDLITSLLTLNFKISIIKKFGDAHCDSYRECEELEEEITFYDSMSDNFDDLKIFDDYSGNDDGENKNVVDDDVNDDYDDGRQNRNGINDNDNDFDQEDQNKGFDDIIVRIIDKSINSILSFMTLNCNFSLFSHNNDQSNSYLSLISNKKNYKITDFLNDIDELHLESHKSCSINEMLLLDISESILAGVKWKIKERDVLAVKMVEQIKVAYDLEIIHLFVQIVFKTIMKIILSKTQIYDNEYTEDVVKLLKDFYEQFILYSYNLPPTIVEIFTTLNDFNGIKPNDLSEKITLFMEFVSEISIGSKNQLFNLSLENVLRFLLSNVESVRCFIRVYEFLRGEYGRYYVPFLKDTKKRTYFLTILIMRKL